VNAEKHEDHSGSAYEAGKGLTAIGGKQNIYIYIYIYSHIFGGMIIDGVWIGELDLKTYTHHSELQVITALSLISTLHKSLAQAKSSQSAFTSRFMVTDLNNEDSPSSVLKSLLSGEYPATEVPTTDDSTIAPSLLSLP
jgi:hypothetical protein